MSKFDIRNEFECQNRILNVKMRYSARIRMSKNEKRKAKNEKRKTKNKLTSPLIEYRKTKNEKQTNFTLLLIFLFYVGLSEMNTLKVIESKFVDKN